MNKTTQNILITVAAAYLFVIIIVVYFNVFAKPEIIEIEKEVEVEKIIEVTKEVKVIKFRDVYWYKYEATGYSANDQEQGTNNIVATTFNLDLERVKNLPVIAVDPDVIPLYSIVEIEGLGGFIALDTGGKIKGNKIDILFSTKKEAKEFGRREVWLRILKN